MVVPMKHDERRNMWIFLRPLSWGLWLTTGGAFILTGFIIWFLEHRSNMEFRGTREQQLGMIFWFSFSTLVFAHKERVLNNWSRFVLIIWLFVVLIITQSYTASLASILTVQRLQPAFMDVKEIKRNNYFVGYQKGSFVKRLLMDHLGFEESKLKAYENPEEFHQALSLGSNNGGVAAIIDEIPYLKILLKRYGYKYAMVGPTYKTGGFGFAFPRKSRLVSYFSRAILNVTEDDKFEKIESRYFSSGVMLEDQSASINSDSPRLTVYSFSGLFIITLVTSLLSLFFYVCNFLYSQWPSLRSVIRSEERSVCSVMAEIAKHFYRIDSSLHPNPPNGSDFRLIYPSASPGRDHGAFIPADGMDENQSRNDHNEEASDVTSNNDNGNLHQQHGDTSTDIPDYLP